MALKDLLVILDQSDGSLARLRLAVDLARRHESWLTALYVREWSPAQLLRRKTAELAGRTLAEVENLVGVVEDSIDQSAHALRTELERCAAQYRVQAEWRAVEGVPSEVVPQHARYADLCMLDVQAPAVSTSAGYRFSEEMVFISGRPVMLVPSVVRQKTLGAHVAIAWNSSRAAARVINDALPLLERAERTTVIAVNPDDYIGQHHALPLPQLTEHLRRHGVTAHCATLTGVPTAQIAAVIQHEALAAGADMLVAGAHGHVWLREVVLGSVTRDLLSRLELPVLMSN